MKSADCSGIRKVSLATATQPPPTTRHETLNADRNINVTELKRWTKLLHSPVHIHTLRATVKSGLNNYI